MVLNRNLVVLVDTQDLEMGTAEKIDAHRRGQLHRAISVFISNDRGEMLLQRRAAGKYHSAGLWSNACCSHPCPGELPVEAASRRLQEELGFTTALQPAGTWYYQADVGANLIEHEFDHLFTGIWNDALRPDPAEVSETAWIPLAELRQRLRHQPETFTAWFPQIFEVLERRRSVPVPS